MAAPTFLGTVTVWGIDGTIAYTGLASADSLLENIGLDDGVERHESKDKQGETVGVKLFNPVRKVNIAFYPCKAAGTGSIAAAKSNVILPVKGAKVTVAGMAEASAFLNDTTWLYLGGGRIDYTNTGECKMTLPCERFNTDIAATANT